MNIWNKEKRIVKCVKNNDNTWGGTDKASGYLVVGELYNVINVDIHDCHTKITLAEFPDRRFNSVLFDELEDEQ